MPTPKSTPPSKHAAEQERLDVQAGVAGGDQGEDADRPDDDGRPHDLHHRPVLEQELADDDRELRHPPLLEQDAEDDPGHESEQQLLG